MFKFLWCVCAFLLSAAALQADVFTFTYSGSGVSVTGTLTATDVVPGIYTVTNIAGTRNGTAFDNSPFGGGTFTYSSSSSAVGTLYFSVGSLGLPDTVIFANNIYSESGALGVDIGSNFSISRAAEPAVLSLLFTMGLGGWFLARKLPSKHN